jgi:hypothetical protein
LFYILIVFSCPQQRRKEAGHERKHSNGLFAGASGLFSAVYSPLYEMLTAGSIAAFQRASAMFVAPLARAMLSA